MRRVAVVALALGALALLLALLRPQRHATPPRTREQTMPGEYRFPPWYMA